MMGRKMSGSIKMRTEIGFSSMKGRFAFGRGIRIWKDKSVLCDTTGR